MVADFYTKPLQGKQFKELRAVIMGHKPTSMEEHVEEKSIDVCKERKAKKIKTTTQQATYRISNNFSVRNGVRARTYIRNA